VAGALEPQAGGPEVHLVPLGGFEDHLGLLTDLGQPGCQSDRANCDADRVLASGLTQLPSERTSPASIPSRNGPEPNPDEDRDPANDLIDSQVTVDLFIGSGITISNHGSDGFDEESAVFE
jgi:hypothetical protein